jgi:quinol monooxygenase YgiN
VYGLIGQIEVVDGGRGELADLLTRNGSMPGCRSYVVAFDQSNPNALWVTEVWDSKDSHAASLALPAVQEAIAHGRKLIVGFLTRIETEPIGGIGLTDS